jgi:lysophospholipid acyltransferase (LPLAT)-like uncharacterized protein
VGDGRLSAAAAGARGIERGARYPWWMGLAAFFGAALLRVLGSTWRIEWRGVREYDVKIANGERCIFAVWHARMLPFAFTHRGRGIVVLVSRHRDGEIIARIVERLGFGTARGSSTRGGEEGVREMLDLAGQRRLLGITPDGPRGPAERVKPGLVYLASRTGLPVVPLATGSRSAWVFHSWDRFRVPRLFARIVVAYGAPIPVPPTLSPADAEDWRTRIERALASHTAETMRAAGES